MSWAIDTHYFSPNVNKELITYTTQCWKYQKTKICRRTKPAVIKINIQKGRFKHVHMDIVALLIQSNGRCDYYKPFHTLAWATTTQRYKYIHYSRKFFRQFHNTFRCSSSNYYRSGWCNQKIIWWSWEICTKRQHYNNILPPAIKWLVKRLHRQIKACILIRDNANKCLCELSIVIPGLRPVYKEYVSAIPW